MPQPSDAPCPLDLLQVLEQIMRLRVAVYHLADDEGPPIVSLAGRIVQITDDGLAKNLMQNLEAATRNVEELVSHAMMIDVANHPANSPEHA